MHGPMQPYADLCIDLNSPADLCVLLYLITPCAQTLAGQCTSMHKPIRAYADPCIGLYHLMRRPIQTYCDLLFDLYTPIPPFA